MPSNEQTAHIKKPPVIGGLFNKGKQYANNNVTALYAGPNCCCQMWHCCLLNELAELYRQFIFAQAIALQYLGLFVAKCD